MFGFHFFLNIQQFRSWKFSHFCSRCTVWNSMNVSSVTENTCSNELCSSEVSLQEVCLPLRPITTKIQAATAKWGKLCWLAPPIRETVFFKKSSATVFPVIAAMASEVHLKQNICITVLQLPIMLVLLAKSGCGCPAGNCAHYRVSAYTLPKHIIKNFLRSCGICNEKCPCFASMLAGEAVQPIQALV